MFSTISSLTHPTICNIVKVDGTSDGRLRVDYLILNQDCVGFAVETGFTTATFYAHYPMRFVAI